MAYAHVAHDCAIGNYVILANASTLGGHVRIDDHAILGGLVAIHQFIRIGTFAFLGGKSGLRMAMPPYMLGFGAPAKLYGPNLVGLRRHGLPRATIQALKNSYQIMFRSGLTVADAIAKIREEVEPTPEVENLIQFMLGRSKRGVTRR
jgi:UDP-N-acetylglucosamine acyltransferase